MFDLANATMPGPDYAPGFQEEKDLHGRDPLPFPGGSTSSSINGAYSPEGSPNHGNEGPSAPHASSRPVAEAFGTGNQADFTGLDEAGNSYQQLLGFIYPTYDPHGGFASQTYTHVDPTQLLGVERDPGPAFHASPSSDGWGGVNSSSTASPEPFVASNSSTPASTESGGSAVGAAGNATTTRATAGGRRVSGGLKRLSQDAAAGGAGATTGGGRGGGGSSGAQRKKSSAGNTGIGISGAGASVVAAGGAGGVTGKLGGRDAGQGVKGAPGPGAGGDDGDSTPTVCTNCHTTNTPLWRRDPDGQPLCEFSLNTLLLIRRAFVCAETNDLFFSLTR